MSSDLTVVISVQNRKSNLDYCLSSINYNTYKPNVIIVDFGSTIPLAYPQYDFVKVIRVINNTNFFHKSRANNIGIRNVFTKYICLTDADEIFQDNFFSVINTHLQNNSKCFIKCKTYAINTYLDFLNVDTLHINYNKILTIAKDINNLYGDGCLHVTNTDFIKRTGGSDEKFIGWGYEDSDLTYRSIRLQLKSIDIAKKTTMIHLPHGDYTSNYYSTQIRNKNKAYYDYKKEHKIFNANTIFPWGLV